MEELERLPHFLVNKLKVSDYGKIQRDNERTIFDKSLNSRQREKVAKEVLLHGYDGQRDIFSIQKRENIDESNDVPIFDYDAATAMAHRNRHLTLNSKFLQLTSYSAPIQAISAKEVKQLDWKRLNNTSKKAQTFTFGNQTVLSDPGHTEIVIPKTVASARIATAKSVGIARASAYFKKLNTDRTISQIKNSRDSGNDLKNGHTEALKTKQVVLKRIADFKKRITERLEETQNKSIQMIMKCIDDSLIHEFMERFKGTVL